MSETSNRPESSAPLAFSRRREWAKEQSISYLMEQGLVNRDVISLAAGFVDEHTLPTELVQNVAARILNDKTTGQRALQYGATGGNTDLQQELLNHLSRLEQCDPSALGIDQDQLVITAGSQQLLNLSLIHI